mmetsp:Transcript_28118/g.45588  ORF Transcript_28118/g.45588 Transcript_28118/m.45588 type:complete len:509 (-) Transcript_28118:27-1553(-)|eukprot:CAMPEP_0184673664 /NCGR_PEP_ID=MMETSP0308-20130426/86802_1 /TAXON_ID=38269 /ORGANISM="Gloeochaete witrockiana, Strain SAG 46.84" /LENGTH=508 /DNA_ID=CAMNT_0027121173 /DNA_START=116 /DNA_END=1642 /DNA_ORIENTATION=-
MREGSFFICIVLSSCTAVLADGSSVSDLWPNPLAPAIFGSLGLILLIFFNWWIAKRYRRLEIAAEEKVKNRPVITVVSKDDVIPISIKGSVVQPYDQSDTASTPSSSDSLKGGKFLSDDDQDMLKPYKTSTIALKDEDLPLEEAFKDAFKKLPTIDDAEDGDADVISPLKKDFQSAIVTINPEYDSDRVGEYPRPSTMSNRTSSFTQVRVGTATRTGTSSGRGDIVDSGFRIPTAGPGGRIATTTDSGRLQTASRQIPTASPNGRLPTAGPKLYDAPAPPPARLPTAGPVEYDIGRLPTAGPTRHGTVEHDTVRLPTAGPMRHATAGGFKPTTAGAGGRVNTSGGRFAAAATVLSDLPPASRQPSGPEVLVILDQGDDLPGVAPALLPSERAVGGKSTMSSMVPTLVFERRGNNNTNTIDEDESPSPSQPLPVTGRLSPSFFYPHSRPSSNKSVSDSFDRQNDPLLFGGKTPRGGKVPEPLDPSYKRRTPEYDPLEPKIGRALNLGQY